MQKKIVPKKTHSNVTTTIIKAVNAEKTVQKKVAKKSIEKEQPVKEREDPPLKKLLKG